MPLDQSTDLRIGQRNGNTGLTVPKYDTLPENPFDGQLVYDVGVGALVAYDSATDSWQAMGGGGSVDLGPINTDLSGLHESLGQLQLDLDTANTDIGQLQLDLGTNNVALTTAQADISANNSAISQLQTDLGTANTDIGQLQLDLGGLNTDLTTLQTDLSTNTSAISTLNTDLSQLDTDQTALQTQLDAVLPITTAKLADDAVTNLKIGPGAVGTTEIAGLAINSGLLADNAVSSVKIAAGAVNTAKLTAGSVSDNLVRNPGFEDWSGTLPDGWTVFTTGSYLNATYVKTTTALTGSTSMVMTAPSGLAAMAYNTDFAPTTAGETIYGSFLCKAASAVAGNAIKCEIRWYDSTSTLINTISTAYALPTTTTRLTTVQTAPANAVKFRMVCEIPSIGSGVAVTVDDFEARKVMGSAMIADAAIINAKIANAAVDNAKIANLDATKITTGSLDANRIGADTINATHIAANAITASELAANAVTATKILAGEVQTAHMTAGAITGDRITVGTLAGDRITVNTLNGDRVIANTLSGDRVIANTMSGDRVIANTLDAGKIVAGSITTDRMTANTISGDRIAAGTLNADRIVSGSVTTTQLTANSINGDRITANTLDAAKIVAGSITTDRMTANSISGDRITGNTLDAGKIVAGSITTDRMTANSINGDRITGGTIAAGQLTATAIDGKTITGPLIRTSDTGNRLELTNLDELDFYSGLAGELSPGKLFGEFFAAGTAQETGSVYLSSPKFADLIGSFIRVRSSSADRAIDPSIDLSAFDGTIGFTADDISFTNSSGFSYLRMQKSGGVTLGADFSGAVDTRVSAVAPTVTMTTGDVGTGAFRTSVDARADARIATKVKGGSSTATTNASGIATFTHGLGVVPTGISWSIETAALASRYGITTAKTSTTFSVQFYTGGNVALGSGGAITLGYVATA